MKKKNELKNSLKLKKTILWNLNHKDLRNLKGGGTDHCNGGHTSGLEVCNEHI